MTKQYLWLTLPLCMFMSGCVEEAVFEALDEPTGTTTAVVQDNCVELTSDLSQLSYYDDMQEQGFVVRTMAPAAGHPDLLRPYYDTIRVTGDLRCTLVEDLCPAYDMEVFAYIHTSRFKIRARSAHFRARSGAKPQFSGMHIYPNDRCDAEGYITIYGEHLTRLPSQAMITITSDTYGGAVEFLPERCSLDSIRFAYRCCNVGTFSLQASVLGTTFALPESLRVADASLDGIDRHVTVGMPHLMDIRCRSGAIREMSCTVDGRYPMTTRQNLMPDHQWRTVFMGEPGQSHTAQIRYTDSFGHAMCFPPFQLEYQTAWELVADAGVQSPQCVIGGYGWTLKGGWNGQFEHPVRLEKLDFATGQTTVCNSPYHAGQGDVDHLLGYAADYVAFGDTDGSKVYCAAYIGLVGQEGDEGYHWAYGREVIRLFEYDIEADSWTHLFDLPASRNNGNNGYQTWAKVGDRFYFVNYRYGELGYWDRSTGELWSDSRQELEDYYNEYCGYDSQHFYSQFNDVYAISLTDLSRRVLIHSYVSELFESPQGHPIGSTRVIDGILYNGRLLCSAPTLDYVDRTYYGSPDGFHGGTLLPVGDYMYVILDNNLVAENGYQMWRRKK